MYRQIWVDAFIKYNTPLTSSSAVERLFSMGAAIFRAKRARLASRNFQRLVFLKGNLDSLKCQGVAQDDFDHMTSMLSKQIGFRPTNIFKLSFIFLVLLFLVSLIVIWKAFLRLHALPLKKFPKILEINVTARFEILEKMSVSWIIL